MILGLNTNHDYNGKIYHVQTEDSGLDNPVIITHCFIGGTIISTRKLEYGDELERDDLEAHLKAAARKQHREMVQSVMSGQLQKAAQLAGGKTSRRDIPLARDGKRSSRPKPNVPFKKSPLSTVDDTPAPPPPADDVEVLASVEVEFIEDALPMDAALEAEGPMEFPSRVLRAEPLDPIMLAYLLEDDA